MRYLIDGCYGDGNVGDECLLLAVAQLIRQADPEAEIAAFTSDVQATRRDTGLRAIPQCNPLGRNIYGSLAKGLLPRALREIQQADVFILGGGELYRDQPGFQATFGMFYRARMARRRRKRVVALGVGVQQPTRWWGQAVLRSALRDNAAIVCRDAESLQLARGWLGQEAPVQGLPDLVFSLDWPRLRRWRQSSGEGMLRVGIAVKSLPQNHASHTAVHEQLFPKLIASMRELQASTSCVFRVLPFADADIALAKQVEDRLRDAGCSVEDSVEPRVEPLRQAVAELDLLVALPLHASVFGFACGVPTLGLAYDRKVKRLYQSFQVDYFCLEPDQWTSSQINDRLAMLRNRHAALSSQLMRLTDEAAARVRRSVISLLSSPAANRVQSGSPSMSPPTTSLPSSPTPQTAKALTVSVVIPAYRAAKTIRRAIDSVLSQTYPAHEIIVIDDGSPDDLASALATYGNRVTLVRQENQGASAARNHGIRLAQGDLIALLDADDYWTPDKLEHCVRPMQRHAEVGLVASRYVLEDEAGNVERIAGPASERCGRVIRVSGSQLLQFAREISTPTVVVRRELLVECPFDTKLATAEDRDVWIRLLQRTSITLLEDALCRVGYSPQSLSHVNIDLDSRCMLQVIDRYADALGPRVTRREAACVHYRWAVGSPSPTAALRHWLRSMTMWPWPFDRSQVRVRFARLRTLLALARRICGTSGSVMYWRAT